MPWPWSEYWPDRGEDLGQPADHLLGHVLHEDGEGLEHLGLEAGVRGVRVGSGDGGYQGLAECLEDRIKERLLQRLVDLAHGADHWGEGGEDLHGPGSGPHCELVSLAEYPEIGFLVEGCGLKKIKTYKYNKQIERYK